MRRLLPLFALALTLGITVACSAGRSTTEVSVSPGSITPVVTPSPVPGTATSPTPSEEVDIQVASTDLGDVLANGSGMTLYVFTEDRVDALACLGACTAVWEPLEITGRLDVPQDLEGGTFGRVERPDGARQLTIADQPLYTYEGDTEPGDTEGQGAFGTWYAVGPDGAAITNG